MTGGATMMLLLVIFSLCCLVTVQAFSPHLASRQSSAHALRISTTRHVFKPKSTNDSSTAAAAGSGSKKTVRKTTIDVEKQPLWKSAQTSFSMKSVVPQKANAVKIVKPSFRPQSRATPPTTKGATTRRARNTDSALEESEGEQWNPQQVLIPIGFLAAVASLVGTVVATKLGLSPSDVLASLQESISNPQAILQSVVTSVQAMGPAGALYFGLFYCLAELLAVPATPLTLSAGTLFGWGPGVGIVLSAGTVAACIGFVIGKTFLRSYVEGVVANNPKFSKLDTAIGKDGFKLLVLVRLSPIFPFSLTNYIYGSSSIDFLPYLCGTLLGFTPSTIAYVYTGMVGQELLMGDATQPWYVYALGLGALLTLLKLVTDVATGLVEAIEESNEAR